MMGLFSSVKRRMGSREPHSSSTNAANDLNNPASSSSTRQQASSQSAAPDTLRLSSTDTSVKFPSTGTNSSEADLRKQGRPSLKHLRASVSVNGDKDATILSPKGSLGAKATTPGAAQSVGPRGSGVSPRSLGKQNKCPVAAAVEDGPEFLSPLEDPPTPGFLLMKQAPTAFAQLPPLKDAGGTTEYTELLRKKMSICRDIVFEFRGIGADLHLEEKEAKKMTLTEILEFLNEPRRISPELVAEDVIKMIATNLFRPLPPPSCLASVFGCSSIIGSGMLADPDENEPFLESAWPHLQILYELLLRFVMCTDVSPKVAKKYIDTTFVLRLLDLFASEDPREREYLKTIMHRIYGKIMALRAYIRKAIQNVFYRYIYENDNHPGVSELLEILGSIINGFAQPLKEEHKQFLQKSMIPLHKTRNVISFHQQLTYCMTQYIEKDNHLAEPIVLGLIRYWPVANTPKEVLFLNELEEILELTPASEFQRVCVPLFQRLAECIRSPHFQVSERALFFWNNTRVVRLVNTNKAQLYPIVVGALRYNTACHWNQAVQGLTFNVCKLLSDSDAALYDHVNDEWLKEEEKQQRVVQMKQEKWEALKKQIAATKT